MIADPEIAKELLRLRLLVPCKCWAGCERCGGEGVRLPSMEELIAMMIDRLQQRYRRGIHVEGWHLERVFTLAAEMPMVYPCDSAWQIIARMLLECRR